MKWLAYILLVFCFGTSSGQEVPSNDPELSNELLEEFIDLGLKNDFYARYHIEKHLKGIYFLPVEEFKNYLPQAPLKDGCIGLHINRDLHRYERLMLLNRKFKDRRGTIKVMTFHELGHFFGLPHDNTVFPDIMNEVLSAGYVPTEDEIARLFRKIKNIPPSKYMLTIQL